MSKHSHLTRLKRIYADDEIYFITLCTRKRIRILDTPEYSSVLIREWRDALDRHQWAVGTYCIMPDHVHFFTRPVQRTKSLQSFIASWKEWTSKGIKRRLHLESGIWQPEFFDHLIRSDESLNEKMEYVFQNPVRAGLVSESSQWAYSGNIHF